MNMCINCSLLTRNQKFCSRSCNISYHNKIRPKRKKTEAIYACEVCSAATSNRRFCSKDCQNTRSAQKKISQWLSGDATALSTPSGGYSQIAKNYLLSESNNKCSVCGWGETNQYTGNVPLELDHINGDPFDNSRENLRILCPNCHALTATARTLNRRSMRKKNGLHDLGRDFSRKLDK